MADAVDFLNNFSKSDFDVLSKVLKNEKSFSVLTQFISSFSDPNKRKYYESEVKKYEKERGYDVDFLTPNQGFVVKITHEGDGCHEFINVCSDARTKEALFEPVENNGQIGTCWKLPCILPRPRKEVVEYIHEKKLVSVYDVVYHPDALHLARESVEMRDILIRNSVDTLNNNYDAKLAADTAEFVEWDKYIGGKITSLVKNCTDSVAARNSCEFEETLKKSTCNSTYITPEYKIKHASNFDIQDYIMMPGTVKRSPDALVVEVALPEVTSASDINADATNGHLIVTTTSSPPYKLDINLPYPVDEDECKAKFDVSVHSLLLQLKVVPIRIKESPPPSDSGVECDVDIQNNCDCDDMSLSSLDLDDLFIEDDKQQCDNSAVHCASHLLPVFSVTQKISDVTVLVNCSNFVEGSLCLLQDKESLFVRYSAVGGGLVPIEFSFKLVFEDEIILQKDLKPVFEAESFSLTLMKLKPSIWTYCLAGQPNNLKKLSLELPVTEAEESQDGRTDISKSPDLSPPSVEAELDSVKPGKPRRRQRAKSGGGVGSLPLQSPTSSWPRGILKARPRSMSDSQMESRDSSYMFMSLGTSLDSEALPEESQDVDDIPLSSGTKKSVRFNDVICRQVFRSNSSISTLKSKNRRRNERKRRQQEKKAQRREAKDSPPDSRENSETSGTEGEGEKGGGLEEAECDESSETRQQLKSSPSRKGGSKGAFRSKGAHNRAKGRRKGKKGSQLEFCNDMIFQLDLS